MESATQEARQPLKRGAVPLVREVAALSGARSSCYNERKRSERQGVGGLSSASRSWGVFAMLTAGLFWGGSGTISRFAPAAGLDQPLVPAWRWNLPVWR